MKKLNLVLCVIIFCSLICTSMAMGNSIRNIQLTPTSPAQLKFGEQIKISYDYNIYSVDSVGIFVEPITGGELTADCATKGETLYSPGEGRGSREFTVKAGDKTVVDQLRFQVYHKVLSKKSIKALTKEQRRAFYADKRVLIFEFFIPVHYTFSASVLDVVDDSTGFSQDKLQQSILPDGTIRVILPDGRIKTTDNKGMVTIVDPKTNQTTKFSPYVQYLIPPFKTSSADQEWLRVMNDWMKRMGEYLLTEIRLHVDSEESIEALKKLEVTEGYSLYRKVDYRMQVLLRLMKKQSE